MLRDQILALLTAQPGIRSADFRWQLESRAERRDILKCLEQLRRDGLIECYDRSRWCLTPPPAQEPESVAAPHPRCEPSGFIAPVTRARLMAGR